MVQLFKVLPLTLIFQTCVLYVFTQTGGSFGPTEYKNKGSMLVTRAASERASSTVLTKITKKSIFVVVHFCCRIKTLVFATVFEHRRYLFRRHSINLFFRELSLPRSACIFRSNTRPSPKICCYFCAFQDRATSMIGRWIQRPIGKLGVEKNRP